MKRKLMKMHAMRQPKQSSLRVSFGDVQGTSLLRLGLMAPAELSSHNVYALLARTPMSIARIPTTETNSMRWLQDSCAEKLELMRKYNSSIQTNLLTLAYRKRVEAIWTDCMDSASDRLRRLPAAQSIHAPASVAQEAH